MFSLFKRRYEEPMYVAPTLPTREQFFAECFRPFEPLHPSIKEAFRPEAEYNYKAWSLRPDYHHGITNVQNHIRSRLHLIKPYYDEEPSFLTQYRIFLDGLVGWCPLRFKVEDRGTGMWICLPPNSGKTNLMHGIALEDLKRVAEGKGSLIIVDSKAHKAESLIDPWLNLDIEYVYPSLKGRVYVFPPEIHPAINIFDLGGVDPLISLFKYMFTSLVEGMTLTGYQSTLLIKCIHAVKANPNPSVLRLYEILSEGWKNFEPGILTLRPIHRDFFLKPRPDENNPKRLVCDFDSSTYFKQHTQVRARLDNLIGSVDLLYDTLASTKTKINLPELIDAGSVILIPAKTDVLGDAGSELYQRIWSMLLLDAARKRRKGKDFPVFVYFDEAHKGIARDTKFADMLDECRSAGICLTVAHPRKGNIKDPDVLNALEEDCRIRFEPVNTDKKGFFRCVLNGQEHTVRSELIRMDSLPQLTKAKQSQRLDAMRTRYGTTTTGIPGGTYRQPKPEYEYEEEQYTPRRAARKRRDDEGPIIDVEWEDITEEEERPRRRPRRLPPPPASSTDFEL